MEMIKETLQILMENKMNLFEFLARDTNGKILTRFVKKKKTKRLL